jgi:hypothetical protein
MTDRSTRGGYLFASDGSRLNEADNIKNSTDFTGARITIGEIHAYIHRGIVFDLSEKITLAPSATIYLTGKPNGKVVHFHKEIYQVSQGGIEIRLLEDVTATGGTAVTPLNRNRLSARTSSFEVKLGATVTNTGLPLRLVGFPAAAIPTARVVQSGAETEEWILKNGITYALEIKNLSADEKIIYADLCWYELDPPL